MIKFGGCVKWQRSSINPNNVTKKLSIPHVEAVNFILYPIFIRASES